MLPVPRTVTPHRDEAGTQKSLSISALRNRYAFVLLGDPGSGKSTAFEMEANAEGVTPVKARDFITLDSVADRHAGQTVFIDGLDETRAGSVNGRTPLDAIRRQLDRIGRPRFRISCRSADWLGASDQASLQALVPEGAELGVFDLDPLTETDVVKILGRDHDVVSPEAFIREAERQRLDDLLRNPQTLKLLAQAVDQSGSWPTSRQETYDMACRKLAFEPNNDHKAAKLNQNVSSHALFDAAGYLCALHLIADVHSFSRLQLDELPSLVLDEIKNPEDLPMSAVLGTRLVCDLGRGNFAPAHRSIAEFLAAKFIAKKIDESISVRRVLALISGADGGIVSELRAFAAWVSVFSAEFRKRHISDDPLGILKYGDARNFSVEEKRRLLSVIKSKADSPEAFSWDDWHWSSFKDLATTDIATELKRILLSKPGSRGDQIVAICVVRGLAQGEVMEGMGPTLLSVVSEPSWDRDVRSVALSTYLQKYMASPVSGLSILADIYEGAIVDDDDELLGSLLTHLYPEHIRPPDVAKYLHPRKRESLIGHYHRFWHSLASRTPDIALGGLMDGFSSKRPVKASEQWHDYWAIVSDVLAASIERLGDLVDNLKLYQWLGIRLDASGHDNIERDAAERIERWFHLRPDRYKGVQLVALGETKDDEMNMWSMQRRLSGLRPPPDMGLWWLQQADSATTEARGKLYFHNAFWIANDGSIFGGLSLEQLEDWVSARPMFADELLSRLFVQLKDEHGDDVWQIEDAKRMLKYAAERRARTDSIREQLGKISANSVPQHLVYYFALAYQDTLVDARGDNPHQRLSNFLNNDSELVAAAIAALEATILRPDLPTPDEMLASDRKGKIYHLMPALLVGMDLAHQRNPDIVLALQDDLLMKAVVSRYVYAAGNDPAWFMVLVGNRPSLVARAFISYVISRLKGKDDFIHGAYQLANDATYAAVANQVVPKVLLSFPHRARVKQLSTLEYLLKAALSNLDPATFDRMIELRLGLRSLDVAQRVYWLCSGAIINAEKYLDQLAKYVAGKEVRVGHMGAFFSRGLGESARHWVPSIPTLARLIELFAPSCKPDRYASGWVTAEMDRAHMVRGWINRLAASTDFAAAEALQRLSTIPGLIHWLELLGQARLQQSIAFRDFSFVHPNHAQVTETLYQGAPANPADVAAIVNEVLDEIGRDIRTSDLNLYRQFWNVDKYDRLVKPKPEEACRDALTALMRGRLRSFQIECTVEARHANEKRADILCSFRNWSVPVEAKKDSHKELWRGITDQLLPKYSIDPRARGYGIFLVFWFGGEEMIRPSTGRRPTTPRMLLEMLEVLVPAERSRQISVHVVDCSRLN